MCKIGFSLQPNYSLPTPQVIELLAVNGFSAVSPVWTPELNLHQVVSCAERQGMRIQSLHAPLKDIHLLWQPEDPVSLEVQADIFRCVDACQQYCVPVMVLHGWQGFEYTFQKDTLDYRFFDRLVEYTREKGVSVALENLEGEEFLQALLMRYQAEQHIGFCWDSGHDHCYPHKLDFLREFGPRLMMTHLNDNMGLRDPNGNPSGEDDLHLLPYDGNICWEQAIRKLKQAAHQPILNFEFKLRTQAANPDDVRYAHLTLEEYLHLAGQRARRIAELYQNTP